MDPREERLEHACTAFEDVDVVDPAGVGGVVAALHLDDRCDEVRLVRQQQVVVGRDEVEGDGGSEEQTGEHPHQPERCQTH